MAVHRVLVVVRHAAAGQAPGHPDIDRPLTAAGAKVAARAGEWLRSHAVRPDAVVCSPAVRARTTWDAIASSLDVRPPATHEPRIYEADVDTLIQLVGEVADDARTVAVVGHNPGMHALVTELTGSELERFPAGAAAILDLSGDWPNLGSGVATLRAVSRTD